LGRQISTLQGTTGKMAEERREEKIYFPLSRDF